MYLEWDTSNFTTGLDLQGHAPPFPYFLKK